MATITTTRPKLHPSLSEESVTWIPVETILNAYSPDFESKLCDCETWMAAKEAAPEYARLRESILTEGLMDAVFYGETENENGETIITVGNGHHRLAILIAEGYTEIPTTDDFMASWDEHGCLSY